ncbi:MAG: hypothetical protein IPO21_16505 [Bacteroidales bacterium]|nr:hypothetical protein [Bacteroidales bacterium]
MKKTFYTQIVLFLLFFVSIQAFAANRYWVGGAGAWTDKSHWAVSSGGVGGATVPTATDDVYFDQQSFSAAGQMVAVKNNLYCKSFNWTSSVAGAGITGKESTNLFVSGSFNVQTAFTNNYVGTITFTGTEAHTIASEVVLNSNLVFNSAASGVWNIVGQFSTTKSIELLKGNINLNHVNLEAAQFITSGSNSRSLVFYDSKITINDKWSILSTQNFTFDSGNSLIVFLGDPNTDFDYADLDYNHIVYDDSRAVVFNYTYDYTLCQVKISCDMTGGVPLFRYLIRKQTSPFTIIHDSGLKPVAAFTFPDDDTVSSGVKYRIDYFSGGVIAGTINTIIFPDYDFDVQVVVEDYESCAGDLDFALRPSITGGTGPDFDFVWDPAPQAPNLATDSIGTNFAAYNNFTCRVTDEKNCTRANSLLYFPPWSPIPYPGPFVINSEETVTATCQGASTGLIVINALYDVDGYGYDLVNDVIGNFEYSITTGGADASFVASNSFTNLAAGTYEIWVKDDKGCKFKTKDAVVISDIPSPTADAGAGGTICENESLTVSGASAANNGSVLWTALPDGSFTPDNALATSYTPGPLAIAAGSATITLAAIGNGSCPSASDNATVTINNLPTANAGVDANVCSNSTFTIVGATVSNEASVKWTTTGDGTFSGNGDILLPIYTPGTSDKSTGSVTLTLTANGIGTCADASNSMLLTIIPAPVANVGGNAVTCSDDQYTFSTASATNETTILWSSNGTGVWLGGINNIEKPTYVPSAADVALGSVQITMRVDGTAPCAFDTDVITLSFETPPTADAGLAGAVCAGSPFTVSTASAADYASLAWTSTGDGSFAAGNSLTPSYTPGAADNAAATTTRTLTLTAYATNVCPDATDNFTLTINKAPTASAGANAAICENSTYTLSNAVVTNQASILWTSSGTGSFGGNQTLQNPTYTPSAADKTAGFVDLTVTASGNGGCASAQSTMRLSFDKVPTVDAGSALNVCQGSAVTVSNASAQDYNTLTWSSSGTSGTITNGSGLTPTYTNKSPDAGTVTLTLTATSLGACPNVSDNTVVTIIPSPTVNPGVAMTICETGVANITDAVAQNYSSIAWSQTGGTGVITNGTTLSPTYTPSVGDQNNATLNVTMTITVTGNAPCTNITANKVITIQSLPIIDAGNPFGVCQGSNAVVSTATATEYATVNWTASGAGAITNGTSLTPTYTPTLADIANGSVVLTLTATGKASCGNSSDNVTVTINPAATAFAGNPAEFCQNESFICTDATATNASSYKWTSNGDGSFSPSDAVLNPTYNPGATDGGKTITLTLTATSSFGCANATSTVALTIRKMPVVDAGIAKTICESGTISLSDASASDYASLLWSASGDGSFSSSGTILKPIYTPGTNDINNATTTVTLTLTAQGLSSCPDVSDNLILTINASPTVSTGGDQTICANDVYQFATATATDYDHLLWVSSGTGSFDDNSIENPTYSPSAADISAGFVDITLTAYGNTPCGNVSESMRLTFEPAPIVEAGSVSSTCYGADLPITGASASNYIDLTWSTSGDGSFVTGATALDNPIYKPGANDLSNGSVVLTLTSTGNAPCLLVSDDINVTLSPKLDVAIGAPSPFLIKASTKISVCFTADHTSVQELGFYLISPEGVTLTLEASPSEFGNPMPPCNFGDNVDNLCFTTEAVTPLSMCKTPPFPPSPALSGSYQPQDGWNLLYNLDPAQGGWTLQIRDYVPGNTGVLKNASITFTDLDNEGNLATVAFNSGVINAPIKDPVIGFRYTSYIIPMGLRTSCYGACDATAIVSPIGGTPPYVSYNWDNVNIPDMDEVDLCAGTFSVTVTDANGCTGTGTVTVTEPDKIESNLTLNNNVLCKGDCSGSATVAPDLGIIPYTYAWSNGQNTATANALCAVKNYITITDANSCSVTDSITITEPALGLSLTATSVAASCFSSADGSLSIVVSGGTLTSWIDYQYAWNTGATTASVNGLTAGTYTVTVTDQNGCTIDTSLVVTAPTELIASTVLIKNVSCNSGSDGSVSVSAIGGTPNYTYLWDDASASTTAMISGLPAGTYNVTVTDTKGCTDITSIGVTEPAVVSMSFTALLPQGLNVSCNGLCDAQVQVTASGGTAPYPTYAWSQVGVGNSSTAALCSGKTYVTITDSKGCTGKDSVTIGAPLQISTVVTGVNVLCKGEATGSASVVASNGFTPYNYQWSDALSQSGANATGLIAGKYYVTVSDVNSCSVVDSITITEPALGLSLTASSVAASCFSSADGSLSLVVSGGTLTSWTDYQYAWNTGATTASVNGLVAGTYTVTVTDQNGCTIDTSLVVTAPTELIASTVLINNVSCNSGSDGSVSVSSNWWNAKLYVLMG